LGIRCFLQNISLLIVEGVGGCYNADSVTSVQQLLVGPSVSSLSPNLDRLKLGKEQEQESETEVESGDVFTFEVGEEAALMEQSSGEEAGAISGTPSRNSVKVSSLDVHLFEFRPRAQLGVLSCFSIHWLTLLTQFAISTSSTDALYRKSVLTAYCGKHTGWDRS
jgi:hypothetical protein